MYEGMIAETVRIQGHGGDTVEAYAARPLQTLNAPGVVVIHHMPGWDPWTKEVVRKFAHNGYAAIAPHLYSRIGAGPWDDIAAQARAEGGVADAQVMGDVAASSAYLRRLATSNGKVGVIGFCSGGRHTYLAACTLPELDAAVDCWGGRVIASPEDLDEKRPRAPIDLTADMHCPLLGIFGNEDTAPSPDQVDRTERELQKHGKTYEFHRYDGAGHGFFATERPNYRQAQAVDGWNKVFDFFGRYLATA